MNEMKKRVALLTWLLASIVLVPSTLAAGTGLKPGDKVGGAVLTTGLQGSVVLPLACAGQRTNCQLPPVAKLAIGPDWWTKDQAHLDSSWPLLTWELDIDGQQVNLDAFGNVGELEPRKGAPGAPADTPVNYPARVWDVVLLNPAPGPHTWHFVATFTKPTNDGWDDYPAGPHEENIQFTIVPGAPAPAPDTIDNSIRLPQASPQVSAPAPGNQRLPSTGAGDANLLPAAGLALALGLLLGAWFLYRSATPMGHSGKW
jgi:LPXTG-motif cell wall-anchored protein